MKPTPEARQKLGKAFYSLEREHGDEPLEIEGAIPHDLKGTLVRNGPALFELFGHHYEHWLDGDGAISVIRLRDGAATGAVHITESPQLKEERAKGEAIYSTGFTLAPSWWRRLGGRTKNSANVHAFSHQGRLYAMGEMSDPIEVHPRTLETLGEWTFGDMLATGLNAHFRKDPHTGTQYGFGLALGAESELVVYAFPQVGDPHPLTRVTLRHMTAIHDFAMSESSFVFFSHPVKVNVPAVLLGTTPAATALRWDPEEGTEVIVISRTEPHEVVRFTVPAFYHFHFGNAFDLEPGKIAVDFFRYDSLDAFDALSLANLRSGEAFQRVAHATLERGLIDLVEKTFGAQTLVSEPGDFPTTAPSVQGHRNRYVFFVLTRDDREIVARYDAQTGELVTGDPGPDRFVGEITFVHHADKGGESDGWLLATAYDAAKDRTGVVIFDALHMQNGPVGSAWFAQRIPFPLHGIWVGG
jgi:all-trans-8'-apo-beta-carotenal 15,15'-oxygenase